MSAAGGVVWRVPPADQLARLFRERLVQRRGFVGRAQAWAVARGDLVLTWPRDEAAVLALGVPCDDCVTVVTDWVTAKGRGPHWVERTMTVGEHWASGIVAKCGRSPRWMA